MKPSDQNPLSLSLAQQELVHSLLSLPPKIMLHHDISGLAQLVLHELAHDRNFKLKKAIYLADNPDFDHLVGVAGYSLEDKDLISVDMWSDPVSAIERLNESTYSKQIKAVLQQSMKARHVDLQNKEEIERLGKLMGLEKPQFFSWDLKHGNHGLFIFEYIDSSAVEDLKHKLLSNAAALLGFCPLF
ncbi:hypothetical protein FJ366_02260 [Candidatus Dependentiae bacterium]|nr:hypothetical protein [Candidatus Dependentiae bacterium]